MTTYLTFTFEEATIHVIGAFDMSKIKYDVVKGGIYYMVDMELHREDDLPAIILPNETKKYYLKGEEYQLQPVVEESTDTQDIQDMQDIQDAQDMQDIQNHLKTLQDSIILLSESINKRKKRNE